jgi:hypothetical protein
LKNDGVEQLVVGGIEGSDTTRDDVSVGIAAAAEEGQEKYGAKNNVAVVELGDHIVLFPDNFFANKNAASADAFCRKTRDDTID